MVRELRGQSGLGMLAHLAEGENHHCDNLVLLGRSWGCPTIWLKSNHCGYPLSQAVVIHGDEEVVKASADDIHGEEILLGLVNGDDVVEIDLDDLAELQERLGVNLSN